MKLDSFVPGIRRTVQRLYRSPAFTAVTLLTLSLGIGANAAIFSIMRGVVLRPPEYREPGRLMYLTTRTPALGYSEFWVSPPEYLEFRELNRSFSAVGAFRTSEVNLLAGDRPTRVAAASVDGELFRALGINAAQGRLFRPGETDARMAPPGSALAPPFPIPPLITILSHELWQSAFAGEPMIGKTIRVDGIPYEVIGVMPPRADIMDNGTKLWLPLGLNPANRLNRGAHNLYLIGRLKDGVTPQAAQADLDTLLANWGGRADVTGHVFHPGASVGAVPGEIGHVLQMQPLEKKLLGSAAQMIWTLQAAVGFLLLIICANLANLLLARAESRRREFAVRAALGANRRDLMGHALAESLVLALAGGLLGLALAQAGLQALLRAYPMTFPRQDEIAIDPWVMLFTVLASVATGAAVGLAGIMDTSARGILSALNGGTTRSVAGSTRHQVRRGLVVAEVALAVVLVLGAGLLVQTVRNFMRVDAGFERNQLVTFSVTLPVPTYPQAPARMRSFQRIIDGLRAIPGIQSVTAMSGQVPERPPDSNDTDIDNYTPAAGGSPENVDFYQRVMSGYFETMGIPILDGRGFEPRDASTTQMVAVVNQSLANTFWKGRNPIGQRLRPCCGDQVPWYTVIGVAKDVKQAGLDKRTGTEVYFFVEQTAMVPPPGTISPATMHLVLRTSLPIGAVAAAVERVRADAAPTVPVVRLRAMNEIFDESIGRARLLALLLGGFAAIALLIAAVGTYGVLSFIVGEQRREIGIRLALGSVRRSVLTAVLRRGLTLTAIGLAFGLALSVALAGWIKSLLFGIEPMDIGMTMAVMAMVTSVATIACWLPAWRASRVDPLVALRDD